MDVNGLKQARRAPRNSECAAAGTIAPSQSKGSNRVGIENPWNAVMSGPLDQERRGLQL